MRLLSITILYLTLLVIFTHCESSEENSDEDVKSKEDQTKEEEKETKSGTSATNELHNVYDKKSYQVLLKTMREHQSQAVESMFKVQDNKQLKALVFDVAGRMIKVMKNAKKVIESEKYRPGVDPFPVEDPLRESVAKIIENTAFYYEMTVKLPDFMDHFTHKEKDVIKPLIKWCYEFVQKMDIYDDDTTAIVLNGAQELLVVPRPKGYKNPNRKIYLKNMKQEEAFAMYQKMLAEKAEKEKAKKSEAKLKAKKPGPKLSERSEL